MDLHFQQPKKWGFIEDLKRPETVHLNWPVPDLWEEPDIRCLFRDPEGVVETAVDYLWDFMRQGVGPVCPVTLKTGRSHWKAETYEISSDMDGVQIRASEPEGLRRGIYELVSWWKSSPSPKLPERKICRSPWLKNRISRCFFSPINRPPANRDELLDQEDYYPEPYLHRLAAAGINGLWISAELQQLCGTSFTGPASPEALRRIEKLKRTVEKCRLFGIRIFLQMNEPVALVTDDPLYRKYPMLKGVDCFGRSCFCPSSPEAGAYLEEACRNIFTAVPHLGGIINITLGEGMTTCASADYRRCPRCSRRPWKEMLHSVWRAMRKGMDAGNPEADLISWLYLPSSSELDERIYTLLEGVPDRVTVQLNCESGAEVEQNGGCRRVGDYWLSVAEPSGNFVRFAEIAAKNHVAVSAKIQVGCSHEVATVPFVPVPGLLYRKYCSLKKLGVETVMMCWYFGNYPGLMNYAAGQLAFAPMPADEEEFLLKLARRDWGRKAPRAAAAWKLLGEGYSCYPASNMFQYYGPVADGISWPLYFQNHNQGLTPTWLLDPEINGDNLAEALMEMPMKDVLAQMKKLVSHWHRGTAMFTAMRKYFADNEDRLLDIGLVEALDLQFQSALNILQFYDLRSRMTEIVDQEARNTRRMLELTEQDSRLGFHSEAEGYKYYPEKLRWRLQQLQGENQEAVYCLESGWKQMENFRWRADRGPEEDKIIVRTELAGFLPGMDEFTMALDDSGYSFPALLHVDSTGQIFTSPECFQCRVEKTENGWAVTVEIDCRKYSSHRPLRLNLIRLTDLYRTRYSWPALKVYLPARLNMVFYQPANMGRLEEN